MIRRMVIIVAILTTPIAAAGAMPVVGAAGGSRLQYRHTPFMGSDGSSGYFDEGFYDPILKDRCAPTAMNGCVPIPTLLWGKGFLGPKLYFAEQFVDSACTTLFLSRPPAACGDYAPKYAARQFDYYDPLGCGGGNLVRPILEPISLKTTYSIPSEGSGCVASTSMGTHQFALGAPLGTSSFVSLERLLTSFPTAAVADDGTTITVDTLGAPTVGLPAVVSGSRLRAKYEVQTGADGAVSKRFVGWYDSALKVDCSFRHISDGALHCTPRPVGLEHPLALIETFVDAACTKQVVRRGSDPSVWPYVSTAWDVYPETACARRVFYRPGGKVPAPATVYVKETVGCVAVAGYPPGDGSWYAIEAMAPSEFVTITPGAEVSK